MVDPAPSRPQGRRSTWLALLRRLTAVSPHWMVWKNVDSALDGHGDIDSIAPFEEWPMIMREFRAWAAAHGLGPVVICPHAPNLLFAVALRGEEPFFELDLMRRKVVLGATLFNAEEMVPLAVMDDLGFRRARAGAEGILKLINNGTQRNGLPREEALHAKHIRELLAADPEGARAAARLFGRGQKAATKVAATVARGGWDRRSVLAMEGWLLASALREPGGVAARLRFRVAKRRCPVLRACFEGRQVPGDLERWLAEVARTHTVDR